MNLEHLSGETLFKKIRENKDSLIQTKKASLKFTDSIICETTVVAKASKVDGKKADEETPLGSNPDTLDVTVVCNTAWFCDSQMDVLTDKAYDESVALRGNTIPHIADHKQSSVNHVGDVTKVYTKKLSLKELGLDIDGSTTALLMDTTIRKDYNEDVFKFYSNGKINQHSIGLSYSEISLAINSSHESDVEEKALWDKYYPKVINKEKVDKRGYFYIVPKVDVRENSCVLFGANPLTPTLSAKSDTLAIPNSSLGNDEETITQPSKGTNMTLEQAQGKIISLTEELAKANSDIALAKVSAKVEERTRITGILKASSTFGNSPAMQKAAMDFIDKGIDADIATTSFEVIKSSMQKANPVDTSEAGLDTSISEEVLGKALSAKEVMMKTMEAGSTASDFGGLL